MTEISGVVVAVCTSKDKGERKTPVESVELCEGSGIAGDAHAGSWRRQVSLLAEESIDKMRQSGVTLSSGDFAENLTTRGIDLGKLEIGSRLAISSAVLEITQIGKECHARCAIFEQAGDCVMPREGIFARVLQGGRIKAGDHIRLLA